MQSVRFSGTRMYTSSLWHHLMKLPMPLPI